MDVPPVEESQSLPPAIGQLVYRNYHFEGKPAVIGNMHNVEDQRIDSRIVLSDLFKRAGVQDGDGFMIAIQKTDSRFTDSRWDIKEGGRLEKTDLTKKLVIPVDRTDS